jgi:hypothetical protein
MASRRDDIAASITVVPMSRRVARGGDSTLFCLRSSASAIDNQAMKVYRRAFADEPSQLRVPHRDPRPV